MVNPDLKLEQKYWSEGIKFVAGIDEAGRGPWAGPLVASAVCFDKEFRPDFEVGDSKKLTEKKREELYPIIKHKSFSWGIGIVEASEIDKLGLSTGVRIAMERSVNALEKKRNVKLDKLIIDGSNVLDLKGYDQIKKDKADNLSFSVASASILAKVTRDHLMIRLSKIYPNYGFESHKGYGTKQHREALQKLGPTQIHRFSYKPIQELQNKPR